MAGTLVEPHGLLPELPLGIGMGFTAFATICAIGPLEQKLYVVSGFAAAAVAAYAVAAVMAWNMPPERPEHPAGVGPGAQGH